MILESMQVGMMGVNCYLIGSEGTKEAAVIDPGGDAQKIAEKIKRANLTLKYIILTHAHIDHIMGVEELQKSTGAQVVVHHLEAPLLKDPQGNLSAVFDEPLTLPQPDLLVDEGDILKLGNLELKIFHTPGHTRGGMSILVDDKLFCGDTLFAGSVGRTDFPGGDMNALISSIKDKLFKLPEETQVFPGHMHTTSIGDEKRNNPFVS